MDQERYRRLISGQRKGVAVKVLRGILSCIGRLYSPCIRLRNFFYSRGVLKTHAAGVPVISIGNITAGGTGKTPLVVWLCRGLQEKGLKCAILTRGYKTSRGKLSDEPAILAKNCPAAKVVIDSDRAAGADKAVNIFGADVLVMDDGFQHRKLGRDLDIITIDSTCPFGYGKMLPGGLLREPLSSIQRADAAVITRTDQVDKKTSGLIEEKIASINPNIVIAWAVHAAKRVKGIGSFELSLEEMKGKKVFAYCGIGNPESFLETIRKAGGELAGHRIYNDHYNYTNDDMTDIYEEAKYLHCELILTTQKDWPKTALLVPENDIPTGYLEVEIAFSAGEDKLRWLIDKTLEGKISSYQKNK